MPQPSSGNSIEDAVIEPHQEPDAEEAERAQNEVSGLLARVQTIVYTLNDDISLEFLSGRPLAFLPTSPESPKERPALDVADPNTGRFRQLSLILEDLSSDLEAISASAYDFVVVKAHEALKLAQEKREEFSRLEDESWEGVQARLKLKEEWSRMASAPVIYVSGEYLHAGGYNALMCHTL